MKLGAFMMPSHPPERGIRAGIDYDLAQLRLLVEEVAPKVAGPIGST